VPNQIAHEDYMELELAHSCENTDVSVDKQLMGNIKLKPLLNRINSLDIKVSRSVARPFLGSVGLDLERRKAIGIIIRNNLQGRWLLSIHVVTKLQSYQKYLHFMLIGSWAAGRNKYACQSSRVILTSISGLRCLLQFGLLFLMI
jgi:hypothetical protein